MKPKTSIYLQDDLRKRLKAESRRLTMLQHERGSFHRVSESEVIRRALDNYLPQIDGQGGKTNNPQIS